MTGSEPQESGKPLLTIAIPTYNRSRYLRELLQSLLEDLRGESRIELIVSDNASPDETPQLVEEFRNRGLQLRYIRNETNIGADANFLQCFEQASGKYVWIFGDDDIIVPGGIEKALRLLAADDYSLVYMSPYEFRSDYIEERRSDKLGRVAEVLPDGFRMVRRAGAMLTFISANIVNKEHYSRTRHPDLHEFAGTNLMQLGWVCPVLAESDKNLYVWERLVAGRGGNCSGWGAGQIFGVNLKRVAEVAFGNRRDMATELCNRTLREWFPGTIVGIRRGTGNSLLHENMRELLEPVYRANWRYWLYVYPVITLPLGMAGVWYSITGFSNRVSRAVPSLSDYVFSSKRFLTEP
jgi:abequosyltransferase